MRGSRFSPVRLLRAVILDFDGVIIESNDLKTTAFEALFARFPEHAADMVAYHHAHVSESRFKKFTHLVAKRLGRAANDPLIAELADTFSAEMVRLIDHCPVVPGAPEFLSTVSSRVPIYLASMTPQDELRGILERRGLAPLFAAVYGCPPWPKPRAIREVLSLIGTTDGVIFVGDSAGDQRAALANGVEFLARDSGLPFDTPAPRTHPDMHAVLAAIADRLPPPVATGASPVSGSQGAP